MQHGKITVQEAETVIHYTESRYYTLDDDEGFMTYFHVFDVTYFFLECFTSMKYTVTNRAVFGTSFLSHILH